MNILVILKRKLTKLSIQQSRPSKSNRLIWHHVKFKLVVMVLIWNCVVKGLALILVTAREINLCSKGLSLPLKKNDIICWKVSWIELFLVELRHYQIYTHWKQSLWILWMIQIWTISKTYFAICIC